ncbi:Rho GTPase activation protein [Phaffia rhodozyma]|uniref:Rho GTPase activation protein n=1 Tax=Phaffia rhodozyma TaxID=264483 RepID=A0A0F7SG21_PHARH|nr:Rho GTPase activation protein [Phaffia rhodozyma]
MSTVSLPSTFVNSFWTQDYRNGLEILYSKLEQGFAEDQEILGFIKSRSAATQSFSLALLDLPPSLNSDGFDKDEGAGLRFAFRGIQDQSRAQAEIHLQTAKALANLVAAPYETWSKNHKTRILESKQLVFNWISAWENQSADVNKLRVHYHEKARDAELAEAEARFSAPETPIIQRSSRPDVPLRRSPSTSIPSSHQPASPLPLGGHVKNDSLTDDVPLAQLQSTPVSDRPRPPSITVPLVNSSSDRPSRPPDGAASSTSTPPAQHLLLAGLPLSHFQLSQLVLKARVTIPNHPVRLPILGEYEHCFKGRDLVKFLASEVRKLAGKEEDAAKELVESFGLIKRVGIAGLAGLKPKGSWGGGGDEVYVFTDKTIDSSLDQKVSLPNSPTSPSATTSLPLSFLQRSSSIVSNLLASPATLSSSSFPPATTESSDKARERADSMEKAYKEAVDRLDGVRCRMEEIIEESLRTMGRWETDRLRAIKTVLTEYQKLSKAQTTSLGSTIDSVDLLLDSYVPESDFKAMISRYRTGNYRPAPEIFEPFSRDLSNVVFGGNLQRWAEGTGWALPSSAPPSKASDTPDAVSRSGDKEEQSISGKDEDQTIKDEVKEEETDEEESLLPGVLRALLSTLRKGYENLKDDEARRMVWIYDVPLHVSHGLRSTLKDLPGGAAHIPPELLKRDLPAIAATVKLWLLELSPPVGPDWEEIKVTYPSVGAGSDRPDQALKIEELKAVLSRIPKIKLIVLNGVISHLRQLIDRTKTGEENEVYITKLSLSLGRTIVRPEKETALSIEDRAPSAFVGDLLRFYNEIFPPVIASRRTERERVVVKRRATRPVDRRPSRSNMSEAERIELQAQMVLGKLPRSAGSPPSMTPALVRNENDARLETDEQVRAAATATGASAGTERGPDRSLKLKTSVIEEPLPEGFNLVPPTPIATSAPENIPAVDISTPAPALVQASTSTSTSTFVASGPAVSSEPAAETGEAVSVDQTIRSTHEPLKNVETSQLVIGETKSVEEPHSEKVTDVGTDESFIPPSEEEPTDPIPAGENMIAEEEGDREEIERAGGEEGGFKPPVEDKGVTVSRGVASSSGFNSGVGASKIRGPRAAGPRGARERQ